MLANGAKLGYKTTGTDYINLPGLKEIPEIGNSPEKVDNTALTDKLKQYEMGIGDPGDITYKFRYSNISEDSPYRVLRKMEEAGTVADWIETLADGTTTTFKGQCAVKRTGGGVNGVIDFSLTVYLQSEFTITDPTA